MDNLSKTIPLETLVDQATKYLSDVGYSSVSMNIYSSTWKYLLKYAQKHNVSHFTLEFGIDYGH